MSDIELWRVVQYTDRHTGKPVEGAYYIATPDDGRWIVDDHELAEKVVRVLNGYEGAVEERDALSVMQIAETFDRIVVACDNGSEPENKLTFIRRVANDARAALREQS